MEYYTIAQLARGYGRLGTFWVKPIIYRIPPGPQFRFAVVLDFEATCWENSAVPFYSNNEIIEFSCVLYCLRTLTILAEFQQYVTPTEKPVLSEFCTKLTGITQEQVDNGVPLAECLDLYCAWHHQQCVKYRIIPNVAPPFFNPCVFVTWTNTDLGIFLERECQRKRILKPLMFNEWIDIKAFYRAYFHQKPINLKGALNKVGLEFEGKQHSGLDDARNTARLLGHMIRQNVPLYINGLS